MRLYVTSADLDWRQRKLLRMSIDQFIQKYVDL